MPQSKMNDFSIFAMNFLKLAQDRKLMNRFDRKELVARTHPLDVNQPFTYKCEWVSTSAEKYIAGFIYSSRIRTLTGNNDVPLIL